MLEFQHDANTYVAFGESLDDVGRWIEQTPRKWRQASSAGTGYGNGWDLNLGWEGALRLAREGWTQGALNLNNRPEGLPPPVNHHYDLKYDVGGQLPDVPRFLSGDPAHMITRGKRIGNPPVVHLCINMWILAMISAQEQANYGTAMVALIDKIESTGRRVELDVTFIGRSGGQTVVLGWKVKQASEHCDLAAVAFAIAHPASFRRFGFAMVERSPSHWNWGGYGRNSYLTPEYAALIGADGALLIDGVGGAHGACRTVEGAVQYAAQQINKAAGETLVEVEG